MNDDLVGSGTAVDFQAGVRRIGPELGLIDAAAQVHDRGGCDGVAVKLRARVVYDHRVGAFTRVERGDEHLRSGSCPECQHVIAAAQGDRQRFDGVEFGQEADRIGQRLAQRQVREVDQPATGAHEQLRADGRHGQRAGRRETGHVADVVPQHLRKLQTSGRLVRNREHRDGVAFFTADDGIAAVGRERDVAG